MASTSYVATEEMTNINRVIRLLMGPCTDQLRDLLRFYIPPASFSEVIQREMSQLRFLTKPQKNLIAGTYNGNYDDMDISLLYILLRNVCKIQPHNTGWGNSPDIGDRSVSANVERLRLARNQCGHSTGGMSNADFNRIWSEIRAAVVDLDLALNQENKNQYERMVDFVRFDTMDPITEKRYRDLLLKQTAENKTTMKEVKSLKRKAEESNVQVEKKMKTLKSSQEGIEKRVLDLEKSHIPSKIKERTKSWQEKDKPFHEVHNFQKIIDKVQSQKITTIIGGPGSGKTATARHLALRWQTSFEFEMIPVEEILEVEQYGDPKCKQLFILDDIIGVFGFKREKLEKLDTFGERILHVLGEHSKIVFTCRKAVFYEAKLLFSFKEERHNNTADLKSLAFAENCIVDLEDNNFRLNDQDRSQMLKNHCSQNGVSLTPIEQPNVISSVGIMMYPLLCKLFCSESKYRSSGKEFFEKPYSCILDQMSKMKLYKPIQYASLVLCMFCMNKINECILKHQDSKIMEISRKVFAKCRANVSCMEIEIMDALESMVETFTAYTDEGYSLIHDSIYEVLAYHYGSENQDDMLQYMSSSFVSKKFKVNDISDDSGYLYIKLCENQYPAFAERLVRDLKYLELNDVFMNDTLKCHSICSTFIDELKKLSYLEFKKLFFQKQSYSTDFFDETGLYWCFGRDNEIDFICDKKCILKDRQNVRVISWVLYYGHSQLLQFLFDHVTKNQESIWHVMDLEESGTRYFCTLKEQNRLLTLSCYSGDIEVVKLVLKHCDVNCIDDFESIGVSPLTAACLGGSKQVVEELLRCGAKVNGTESCYPLHVACESGNSDIVDLLIKHGADCNQSNDQGKNSLFKAVAAGDKSIVDLLIKNGADCNKICNFGLTPLHQAVYDSKIDIVDMLVQRGADVKNVERWSCTPLHLVSTGSSERNCKFVDFLIKCGTDVNGVDEDLESPLHIFSEIGEYDVVDLLIKGGADCNQRNRSGDTPLVKATCNNHVAVVDLLIKGGANCNLSNDEDVAPLHCSDSYEVVDLLIKGGANCNQCDKYGETPLHAASEYNDFFEVIDLLIKSGSNVNASDKNGFTPLHVASDNGHVDVVDFLIKRGADCNQSDKDGKTPLYLASEAGYDDVVNFLINCGADCNKSDKDGRTPLYAASKVGKDDVVELLIKNGADCNQSDKDGKTPLHVATKPQYHVHYTRNRSSVSYYVKFGHESVVRTLIESGANINHCDIYGECPLSVARKHNQHAIAEILIEHGAKLNLPD